MKSDHYSRKIPISQFVPWKGKNSFPSKLDLEITERCNNNCSHCYINHPVDDNQARDRELTFGQIQSILEEAICLGCKSIRLTGGEPLIRDDFREIYLLAKKLRLTVTIYTNGTLITQQLADTFAQYTPGEPIHISLYGWDQKTYEAISRTPGSFKAVQKALDWLLHYDIPFRVNPVVLPLKMSAFKNFEKWIASVPELNISRPKVLSLHLNGRGNNEKRNRKIRSLRIRSEKQLSLEAREGNAYTNDLKTFCTTFCHVPGDTLFGCGAGISRASVDAYGMLQPCLMLRHPDTIYDLTTGSLNNGFHKFFPRVRQIRAKNSLYMERCAHCFLIALCEQCPAVSWMETHTLDGWPEHFCNFTHAQARLIGLLDEGEKSWMVSDWQDRIKRLKRTSRPIFSKKNECKTNIERSHT